LNCAASLCVSHAVAATITFSVNPTGGYLHSDPNADIPENFSISPNGNLIAVPTGAKFLFAGVIDGFYADNSDPNGYFGSEAFATSASLTRSHSHLLRSLWTSKA
jgi:hypothetical protein